MLNLLSKVMWSHMERVFEDRILGDNLLPTFVYIPSYGLAISGERLTYMTEESIMTLIRHYLPSHLFPKFVLLSHVYPKFWELEQKFKHELLPIFRAHAKVVDLVTDKTLVSTFSETDTLVDYLIKENLNLAETRITIIAEKDHMPRVVRALFSRLPDVKVYLSPFVSKHEAHLAKPWFKGLINTPFLGIWMWWHFALYSWVVFRDFIISKRPY